MHAKKKARKKNHRNCIKQQNNTSSLLENTIISTCFCSQRSMDPGSGNNIVNVDDDRLSSLPDDIIHNILSFIGIKDAIKTSVLSSRWRHTWTSMRHLNFSTEDFSISARFSQFVEHFLSHRNQLASVFSVKLSFGGLPTQAFVERILNYASTHSVQRLSVTCIYMGPHRNFVFPLSLFSCQSLKHLTLTGSCDDMIFIKLKSNWELPALTTLYLSNFKLYEESSEIFSNCPNLKNLTLKTCMKFRWDRFDIYHSQLLNLTLEDIYTAVYVEAPQLKTLTVSISRSGYCSLKFTGDVLSLEKVDMCITEAQESHAHEIVGLFQQFHSVKFLTLNLEIVELLFSSDKVVSHRSSSFANLESLEIYPVNKHVDGYAKTNANVYSFVKNYFLDNSASATLIMVLREEITARELMQRMLNEWEANTHKELEVKYRMLQQETRWQLQFGEEIESYWKDFYKWLKQGDAQTHRIISMLRVIQQLLQKLPRLQRDKMQSMYSSLCAKADTIKINRTRCLNLLLCFVFGFGHPLYRPGALLSPGALLGALLHI
ncbi:F-box domain, Leucine-rich repeat domain, L domain-like protein [Artemisia annua]|uniref:F-box domain, Leucine-rich repeat domain, L domain-like protein n=1 Tax=Artemisia annua TaxID=35608 RepID=A0A2U1NTR5_ARTAN|nr:F-box domain, Leucine-rich repeat domain, L domain-like protein [Artemisia annua]